MVSGTAAEEVERSRRPEPSDGALADSPSTVVDLLRHGEPVGGRRYRGQHDDPLSEAGWEQMRASVAGNRDWQVIVTSPLSRCAAFAHELSGRLDIPLHTDPRLMEIGFGAWEGKTPEELHAADPGCLRRFKLDPVANRPAGAEPLAAFQARIADAWQELIESHHGRRVLLVGHAGVIRAVLGIVLDIPVTRVFRIAVQNAGITRIRVDGQGEAALPSLVFHGGRP